MDPFASIQDLAEDLRARRYTCRELAQATLSRAREANARLNCLITITDDAALEAAEAADKRLAAGDAGPLTGVPLVHKDIFCMDGVTTTCGSRMLENFVAPYDATVVTKLAGAGVVPIGKANMDEFAMGSSNENSYFGPVENPHGAGFVPGGSSGGSAACVAAGLAPLATGTDTGGSIRQPAAFCGITGLKPTYGRVSRYGMIAFASSLDQGGPMARSATDATLLYAHMAGFDPRDSTSVDRDDAWLDGVRRLGASAIGQLDSPLTIGLPAEYLKDLSNEVARTLNEAKKILEDAGHTLVEVSLPNTELAIPAYYVIAGAEASTNLSRYDGVRFGHRCDHPESLEDLYLRSRSEGFGPEVKRRILTGTYALSVGYYDAYYLKAQKLRRLIQQDFLNAFADVDLLLTPTTPGPAFAQKALADDPIAMYQQDIYTIPASLAGLPALSMPAGSDQGLPLGLQLIAPHFAEECLLKLARDFQTRTDWHTLTPPTSYATTPGTTPGTTATTTIPITGGQS